jgi:hypothetical protein
MQRVHADEGPRDRHADIVQATREAVDDLVQRQVTQGQPVGKRRWFHRHGLTVPMDIMGESRPYTISRPVQGVHNEVVLIARGRG